MTLLDPMPDWFAAADPRVRLSGLAVAIAAGAWLAWRGRSASHPEEVGAAWFLAFLAPVLALTHHSYLYYLYLPWAGACWFAAAAGRVALGRLPARPRAATALVLLAAFAALGAWNVRRRETARVEFVLGDRTVREASLLEHAVPALRAAGLAPGTRVGFVNPIPPKHISLMPGGTSPRMRSYLPLEAALRGGETLKLFVPGTEYAGFADSIPAGWEDVAIFLYDGLGRLYGLGRGQAALLALGQFELEARRWPEAARLYARARAMGDTVPGALYGQMVSLGAEGRTREAFQLADSLVHRWPNHPLAVRARTLLEARRGAGD